jgi:hypothetical protein
MRAREKTAVNSATLILKENVKQKTKNKKTPTYYYYYY